MLQLWSQREREYSLVLVLKLDLSECT